MTEGPVEVFTVRSRGDSRRFNELPSRLYKNDPMYVKPFRRTERDIWNTRKNVALASRRFERIIAVKDGECVGRIAAILDPEFARRWSPGSGFFGFFESIDDQECARRLLYAAESCLRQWNVVRIYGPVNLSTQNEVGFMTGEARNPPMLLSPYNPLYYNDLVLANGYQAERDYVSYETHMTGEAQPLIRRALRIARASNRSSVKVRSADKSNWKGEVHLLWELYNRCFDHLWGFTPISFEEFSGLAREFKAFFDPELIQIAESEGVPCGFIVFLPDINHALWKFRKRKRPWQWIQFLHNLRNPTQGRLLLLGVDPAYTGQAIAAIMSQRLKDIAISLRYKRAEISLVDMTNMQARNVVELFDVRILQIYRLYRKELAVTEPGTRAERSGLTADSQIP